MVVPVQSDYIANCAKTGSDKSRRREPAPMMRRAEVPVLVVAMVD